MDVRDVDVSQVTAGLLFNGISFSKISSPHAWWHVFVPLLFPPLSSPLLCRMTPSLVVERLRVWGQY